MLLPILWGCLALPGPAIAHPHVFIASAVTFVFSEDALTGIRLRWTFDELFSSTVLEGFDVDGDGTFDPEEIVEIERGAFSNLRDYGYFAHLSLDGRAVKPSDVREFSASRDADAVIYSFLLPLPKPVDPQRTDVRIAVYDSEYYVEVTLDEGEPARMEGKGGAACRYTVSESREHAYYFDMIYPEQIRLDCGARQR